MRKTVDLYRCHNNDIDTNQQYTQWQNCGYGERLPGTNPILQVEVLGFLSCLRRSRCKDRCSHCKTYCGVVTNGARPRCFVLRENIALQDGCLRCRKVTAGVSQTASALVQDWSATYARCLSQLVLQQVTN